MNVVEGICESLVPMRNVAEVALDPVGSRRNVKAKTFRISNLGGLVGVACSCKACDDKLDLGKLCGLSVLLTGT